MGKIKSVLFVLFLFQRIFGAKGAGGGALEGRWMHWMHFPSPPPRPFDDSMKAERLLTRHEQCPGL
jgi:hypothetical protein